MLAFYDLADSHGQTYWRLRGYESPKYLSAQILALKTRPCVFLEKVSVPGISIDLDSTNCIALFTDYFHFRLSFLSLFLKFLHKLVVSRELEGISHFLGT